MPTLATPRRLFIPDTPRSKPMFLATRGKRRKLNTLRKTRRTTRKRNLREIVQDLAQEKKRHDSNQTWNTLHQMGTYLCCSEIYQGVQLDQRVGNRIKLTGISIKGTLQHSGSPNTNTAGTWTNTVVVPIYLRIYIVKTTREASPVGFWYQQTNNDANLNYNTGFTTDPTGDVLRSRLRINAKECHVLMRKTYRVHGHRDLQQNFEGTKQINMFYKFKKALDLQYNGPETQTTAYGADGVRPNVWVCYALFQPNTMATASGVNLAAMNVQITTYYRE